MALCAFVDTDGNWSSLVVYLDEDENPVIGVRYDAAGASKTALLGEDGESDVKMAVKEAQTAKADPLLEQALRHFTDDDEPRDWSIPVLRCTVSTAL